MSRITRVIRDIDVTRPNTPTGLAATPVSETQINLTWNTATDPQGGTSEAVTGVAGYKIYRNGTLRITQAGTSFSDTALTAFTQYSYAVTAYDGATTPNESVQSAAVLATTQDLTAPTAPVISAVAASSSAITVSLTSPSTDGGSGVASYTLQRATDAGFSLNLTTTNGVSFPVSVTGLSASTQYFFRARAVDAASNVGSFSATANATTTSGASTVATVTTLVLASPSTGTLPWTFGQWLKRGDVSSANFVTTDAIVSQADVRNRWEDGSARYVVLSGISAVSAGVDKTVLVQSTSSAPSGTNVAEPATLDVSVTFTGDVTGTYTLQTCLGVDRSTWNKALPGRVRQIPGVVMSEFHYYRPTTDAHVAVWFYVRRYSNGATEVETVVENGWLKVASPNVKNYGVTVAINGSTVYAPGSVQHFHHTRWSRVDWINGGVAIVPKHAVAYLRASKAVPNYGYTSPSATKLNSLTQTINPPPFNLGEWSLNMASTGTQNPIALYPQHEALYFTSSDPRAYASTISNNRGSGRWPIYYRDETTGRIPLYASYPNNSLTQGWGTPVPAGAGGGPTWDIPHHPSMGMAAYLIEGRWSQMECAQFSAMNCLLESDTTKRGAGGGVLRIGSPLTTRGLAWSIRTVGQAAAITPTTLAGSASPTADLALQTAFASSLSQSATYYRGRFIDVGAPEQNSVGWIDQYDTDTEFTAPIVGGREWMATFQKKGWGYICGLGIESLTSQTDMTTVRSHLYAGTVRKYGTESTWNFRHAAIYNMPYLNGSSFLTTAAAYTTYKSVEAISALSANAGDTLKNHASDSDMTGTSSSNDVDGYWGIELGALAMAVEDAYPGAQAAYTLATSAPNFNPSAHGASDAPQFAIVPRATTALAIAAARLSAGQSLKFGTIPAAILDIDALPSGGFSPLQYMSSICYDPINKTIGWFGRRSSSNFSYRFILYSEAADTWAHHNPFPGAVVPNGHGYDHNTIDPDTGIRYFRPYNDTVVITWNPSSDSYGTLAAIGSPPPVIAGLLEWIPGTGLVYADRQVMWRHPGASSPNSAWTLVSNTGSSANAYHGAGAWNQNSQLLLWGWGNLDNNSRKVGPSLAGSVQTSSSNLDFGSSEFGGLIVPDPTGPGFLGWKKQTTSWKHYAPSTDTWATLSTFGTGTSSPSNGLPPLSSADVGRHSACCPITPYGVMMFVQYDGGGAGASVYLYRHT